MIDFRYHVVSIVAVFLAIALGLFIGSTTLRGTVATDLNRRTAAVKSENANLSGQVHDLKNQVNDANGFDTALEPYVLRGALTGESVVVVSAPGVDAGSRTNLVNAITAAGGTVTGDVRLQNALLDPDQRTFLDTLTARLTVPGHPTTGGDGSQRAMQLLADVLGIRPQSTPVPAAAAAKLLAGFTDGNLLSVNGGVAHSAPLAVLLVPSPPGGTPDPQVEQAKAALLLDLASDLDRSAVGAVVAGPLAAADSGVLAAARHDKNLTADVSTIDGIDTPRGVIATVLALAEQANGGVGSYGTESGAREPVPTPSPS